MTRHKRDYKQPVDVNMPEKIRKKFTMAPKKKKGRFTK